MSTTINTPDALVSARDFTLRYGRKVACDPVSYTHLTLPTIYSV